MGRLTRQEIADKIKETKKEQIKLDKTLQSLFVERRKLLGGTEAVANMKKTGIKKGNTVSPGGGRSRRP
tara:strand:- start:284 stop:490 length:207 start_codon:yes stop_codon:yes gene_type:complete